MWSQDETKTQNAAGRQAAPVAEPTRVPERRTTAWIGKSVFVKGDVISAEDLIIDGRLEGTISLGERRLTVGVGGAILGDVTAHAIVISGAVTGNVRATHRVEVQETGSVEGDITAPHLAVREGAVLCGHIEVGAGASQRNVKVA